MSDEKITISVDELGQAKVDRRLKEQEAIARTRRYSEMHADELPVESPMRRGSMFWHSPIVALTLFGFIGGLLAWGVVELISLRPDPHADARNLLASVQQIQQEYAAGRITDDGEKKALDVLRRFGQGNPYFDLEMNTALTPAQKSAQLTQLNHDDELREFITNFIAFGACGLIIAVCLSIAEPVMDRNPSAAVMNGAVGAGLGLLGGVAVAMLIDRFGGYVKTDDSTTLAHRMLSHIIIYGVQGCLLALAPGLVMRNGKRLMIGVLGGAIGGIVGGLLYDPVSHITSGGEVFSKLIALIAIGAVAGLATGLIEQAAKKGWVKITEGVIAGKQFILYRNPTYIGCAPDCQIYLFKDPMVGRRHAAIHIVKGGFDIEDLPLGSRTLVNGKPITRMRLRNNDKVQIGSTAFSFQQKLNTK